MKDDEISLKEYFEQRHTDLRAYVDQRFNDANRAVLAALASAKEAVLKSEAASEARFASVNEFRAQLGDQSRTLMPRAEVEVTNKAITDKIETLEARLDKAEGKSVGFSQWWGVLVGASGVIFAIIALILKLTGK